MRCALSVLLLPALLPLALAQDNEAEKLFRDFEKKVKNAKAIRVVVEAKSNSTRLGGKFKIALVLAQGNKMRLLLTETDTKEPGPVSGAVTSNGTKLRMSSRGKDEEKATPKDLHALGSTCVSRAGIITFLLIVVTPEKPDSEELSRVTDFKAGKGEKVGAFGEVQVMDWGLAKVLGDSQAEAGTDGSVRPGRKHDPHGSNPVRWVRIASRVAAHEENRIPPTVMWGTCPTLFDPSQAPTGQHTAFMWEKLPYALDGDAANWDAKKSWQGRAMLEAWSRFAPNLADGIVLDAFTRSPLDTERTLPNMRGGDLLVGSFANGQIGYNRPFAGAGCYRTVIPGLYLCGGSTHPGGNITGLCGYNAARVLAAELGLNIWWNPPDVEKAWALL